MADAQPAPSSANAAYGALSGKLEQNISKENEAIDPLIEKYKSTSAQPLPKPPDGNKTPDAPQPDLNKGMWEFLTTANVLSALAGLGARQHSTAALTAFSAGVQGFRQGKIDDAKQQLDTWKAESQAANENAKKELDAYNAALNNRKQSLDEIMQQMQLISTQYKNDNMTYLAQIKDIVSIEKLTQQMDIAQKGMDLKYQQLANNFDKIITDATGVQQASGIFAQTHPFPRTGNEQDMKAWNQAFTQWMQTPEGQSAVKQSSQNIGGYDEATRQRMADQRAAGDTAGSTVRGYSKGSRLAQADIENRATATGKSGADMSAASAERAGTIAGERTVGNRSANIALAASEANKMADIVMQTSAKVPRGAFVPGNAGEIAIARSFSDPNAASYVAAINSFINAYSRAINPSGQARVSDKEHARELILAGYSDGTIKAVIGTLKQEMQAALQAPGEVKQQLRGDIGGDRFKGFTAEPIP